MRLRSSVPAQTMLCSFDVTKERLGSQAPLVNDAVRARIRTRSIAFRQTMLGRPAFMSRWAP
jgi:hypothetical protein